MSFTELTPKQQKTAVALLEREDRKAVAREKLYAELAAKRASWLNR
ncbi:hypothetical protein N9026_00210 [bacterium]|nr:hypothetical protein [bacterium]